MAPISVRELSVNDKKSRFSNSDSADMSLRALSPRSSVERWSKPDKPLNACDFTKLLLDRKVLDVETGEKLIAIMEKLGIANSDSYTGDAEGQAYISGLPEVTEEMIYEEILCYVNDNPDNELNKILEYKRKKERR